jgi:RNA recognition motif-containing protein
LSCERIKELSEKPLGNEKELTGNFKEKQYVQYTDCESLKGAIQTYNNLLEARNNAIRSYNTKLDERKRKCPTTPLSPSSVVCNNVYQANEKLTELLLDIRNNKQGSTAAFRREFEKIKNNVEDHAYKKCKEYKVFEDLCRRIETRLK